MKHSRSESAWGALLDTIRLAGGRSLLAAALVFPGFASAQERTERRNERQAEAVEAAEDDVASRISRSGSIDRFPGGEVRESGPNHRRLRLAGANGSERGLVQLQTGLNYLDDNREWQPTDTTFALIPGGARAWKGQHKVSLAATPNTLAAVQMRLPDGRLLSSHVHGLAYTDTASGRSVLIAAVKDAQGFQVEPNQILYVDAFDNVSADLAYTYTTAGFEQDVIVRESLPAPEDFGLPSETTQLEVWTEFEKAIQPTRVSRSQRQRQPDASLLDLSPEDELDFGSMRITPGRSFRLQDREESLALIGKHWVEAEPGRSFLVEAVQVREISDELRELPVRGGQSQLRARPTERLQALRALPRKANRIKELQASILQPSKNSVAMDWNQRPGVVLDYFVRNGSYSNYVFYAQDTTVITGPVYLTGTTTFEPGTDIKFTASGGAVVDITGTVNWLAEPFAPVILTASDDSSLGGHYASSTGNPTTQYYSTTGLRFNGNAPAVIQHLRVSHLKRGIELLNLPIGSTTILRHAQFYRCESAVKATRTGSSGTATVSLQNVLMNSVLRPLSDSSNITLEGQHVTSSQAAAFIYNSTSTSGTLVNSVLAGVTNQSGVTVGTGSVSYASSANVFTKVGGGECYLPGPTHRDVGSASINSTLLADLKSLTVQPPQLLRGSVTVNSDLWPLVLRDTGNPDRGYHYPAIDYLIDQTVSISNATLGLRSGVVVAHAPSVAIDLLSQGRLLGTGLPQLLNTVVRYVYVQERDIAGLGTHLGSSTSYNSAFSLIRCNSGASGANAPVIDLRFTRFVTDKGDNVFNASTAMLQAKIRDCQFLIGNLGFNSGVGSSPINFENNLSRNVWMWFVYSTGPVSVRNNLYRGSLIWFNPTSGSQFWVTDNSFDGAQAYPDYEESGFDFYHRYNAYIGLGINPLELNALTTTQIGNQPLSTFAYATGTLGPWYHSSASLQNMGSQPASQVGLYHHTVLASQAKEVNSIVDIGFHRVATDGSGRPLDQDGDGVPDYLEDFNGNGEVDSGETSGSVYNSLNSIAIGDLQVFTVLR